MKKTTLNLVLFILVLASTGCPTQNSDIPEGCGDGELATSEQCEGFELRGETCVSQGFSNGTLTCSESCELEVDANCSSCGDGVVTGEEVCDGEGEVTCESLGFLGGTLQCESDCSAFRTGNCVDGAVGEPCVDGNCAENAFCLDQLVSGGCVARCDLDADCENSEQCRTVEGENFSICAPSGDQNGLSICSPDCLANGCFSCPAPNTCENVSELLGAFFGVCTAP